MTKHGGLSCDEVKQLLDDYLDGELGAPKVDQIRIHLDECAACNYASEFEAAVLEQLKDKLRQVDAPPSLVQKVDELLETEGSD